MTSNCLFRPSAPFVDWIAEAAGDKVEPVTPSGRELAALEKVRGRLHWGSYTKIRCVEVGQADTCTAAVSPCATTVDGLRSQLLREAGQFIHHFDFSAGAWTTAGVVQATIWHVDKGYLTLEVRPWCSVVCCCILGWLDQVPNLVKVPKSHYCRQ